MLVASRVATCARAVLPFATWVATLAQLGYAGYNLFQMYQRYVAQEQRDARQGISRSLDEVIEMVVCPRRRNRIEKDEQSQATNLKQSSEEQTLHSTSTGNSNQNNGDNNPYSPSTETNNSCSSSKAPPPPEEAAAAAAAASANETKGNNDDRDDDEITIVHDSRMVTNLNVNSNPSTTANNNSETMNDKDILDDGDVSIASTSLESTDSNNGIVRDMYTECFICATSLDNPNKPVATLPFCLHPFHKSCLDGVLKWHQKCPVCDFHIFTPI